MQKYMIKTLGCKVNQFESDAISEWFEKAGLNASGKENPDICIVNTCTVTSKASMQSRQAIRQAIRNYPNARIVVTGCYAQTEPDKLRRIDGIHHIVGTAQRHKLFDIIASAASTAGGESKSLSSVMPDAEGETDSFPFSPPATDYRTRPFLKIQDGCNAFCSYCIVPYARGRSQSMPIQSVLKNIRHLKNSGSIEIVLTGIHLGAYGLDLSPQQSLYKLLHILHEKKAVQRLRLSSIEPHELTLDIIRLVKSSPMICDHFHIPLQSGNDEILTRMNRPYTCSFFCDLILNIRETIPEASIGVDVIVGFPGETDDAFNDTYSLIRDLPVSYLHVFPFSPRPGTPAAKFPDKVPSPIVKERSRVMRELGNQKKKSFHRNLIGKAAEVLVESTREKKSGRLKGLTSNYIPVHIAGPDALKNKLVRVRVETMDRRMQMMGKVLR